MINKNLIIEIIRSHSTPLQPRPTDIAPRLCKTPGIKGILFDIYGTLLISGSGDIGISGTTTNSNLFLGALRECSSEEITPDAAEFAGEMYFSLIATGHSESRNAGIDVPEVDICNIWFEVLRNLHVHGHILSTPSVAFAERAAVTYESLANPTFPMPHIAQVLADLTKRGVLLGIVSNAQAFTPFLFNAHMNNSLEELGFSADLCAFSYMLGVAKPSAKIFKGVLENLYRAYGLQPHEVVYVGNDMLNDIWTASTLGCKTCLFAGDSRSLRLREDDKRCAGLRPDAVVTSLDQILHIL